MLDVNELRNGSLYQQDGNLFRVASYDHTKMGRGGATIKLKVRNLLNGAVTTQTFQSGKKVEEADVQQIVGRFKYRTSEEYVFETDDDEIEIPLENVKNEGPYLKKGMEVTIMIFQDEPIGITLPIKQVYTVKEAPPDARGNSANAATKDVTLENNIQVKTPMFIKEGDQIIIDTRNGEYVSRSTS